MEEGEELKAVHARDLDRLVESLGIAEALRNGSLRCEFCGCEVRKENLGAVYPEAGEVRVSCNKADCIRQALAKMKGGSSPG